MNMEEVDVLLRRAHSARKECTEVLPYSVYDLTKLKKDIVVIISRNVAQQCIFSAARNEDVSWVSTIESTSDLLTGLFCTVNDVPVYSSWMRPVDFFGETNRNEQKAQAAHKESYVMYYDPLADTFHCLKPNSFKK